MRLECLEIRDIDKVRRWRNQTLETLRTPFFITKEMQENFYNNIVCCRNSHHRFWAIKGTLEEIDLIGMAGLTNIEWENRNAEISLIIAPEQRRKGQGGKAVFLLLEKAFNELNIENVYGEAYKTNNLNINFWEKQIEKYKAYKCILPNRKYWDGQYFDSLYFNFNKKDYEK